MARTRHGSVATDAPASQPARSRRPWLAMVAKQRGEVWRDEPASRYDDAPGCGRKRPARSWATGDSLALDRHRASRVRVGPCAAVAWPWNRSRRALGSLRCFAVACALAPTRANLCHRGSVQHQRQLRKRFERAASSVVRQRRDPSGRGGGGGHTPARRRHERRLGSRARARGLLRARPRFGAPATRERGAQRLARGPLGRDRRRQRALGAGVAPPERAARPLSRHQLCGDPRSLGGSGAVRSSPRCIHGRRASGRRAPARRARGHTLAR